MVRRSWIALALTLLVTGLFVPGTSLPVAPQHAGAQAPTTTTLRFAVLAPRGSTWHRVFTAWGNTLRTQTQGAVTIQVQTASPGDERNLVAQLRNGQLDGANFTAVGLGHVARPALVLQAPGVFADYAALDRARTAMDPELRALFEQNGTVLMGWSDFGRGRVFTTRPVARPADLRGAHAWVLPDDPIAPEFLQVVGATPVPLPLGGVLGALGSQQVDTVVASATAVSALQWHTRLTHVMQQSDAVLVGGTLMSKTRFDALSPAHQQILRDTARQAHESLNRTIRRDDDRFFQSLTTSHGMQTVDASAHAAEWRTAAQQARERLVGRVFDRALLDRALAAGR